MTTNGHTYGTREPKSERAFWNDVAPAIVDAMDKQDAETLAASIKAAYGPGSHYTHCITGPCRGGKYLCPSPDSCRIAQRSDPPMKRVRLLATVVLIVLLVAAVRWYR